MQNNVLYKDIFLLCSIMGKVMMMNSKHTIFASFIGYITQAIVNNLAPLLFSIFMANFGISLDLIALLVSINFCTQLLVDLLATKYIDQIGYRRSVIAAHLFSAGGLIGLSVFPYCFNHSYLGIVLSVILYAIGGGLIEVLISPIVEACPTNHKASIMSLLHSFYCWGCVLVITLSSAFFFAFGKGAWRILPILWSIIPLCNAFFFTKVPLYDICEEGSGMEVRELFSSKVFFVLLMMMVMAGASEQAMSQWASTFVEISLELPKSLGDLVGPCFFAILMGCSRLFYAKYGEKINLLTFVKYSCCLGVIAFILAGIKGVPIINLLACGLCGLSVGILWPGIFSVASQTLPQAGTAMFALLALGGDLGCSVGPFVVGQIAIAFNGALQSGLMFGFIFPLCLIGLVYIYKRMQS